MFHLEFTRLVTKMSQEGLPWSFYAVIGTFGVFFFSLNVYIFTVVLDHPLRSDLWLAGVALGLLAMIYSIRMARVHQKERIQARENAHV